MSNKDKEGSAAHDEKQENDVADDTYNQPTLGEAGVWTATLAEAQAANAHEHSFTVREALKAYPWAVFWSFAVSMSIIMEGYDTALVGSLYAYPTFAKQFGTFTPSTNNYQISTPWQSAMGSGPQAGAFIGAIANGFFIQRFGYRPAFMIGLVLMIAFIFMSFFGMTIQLQAAAQVLCGVPWGIFATIGSAYASELCPHVLRPYLTSYVNLCFATGQFVSAGVLQSLLNRDDQWAWRIPFAIQWLWPPFLVVAAIFMPESPWHLVRKGRYVEAEKNLLRLMANHEKPHARSVVAMMIHTNKLEETLTEGTSYLDCFKGDNLRRTEIGCLSFLGQITCGIQFAFSATYFFQQAGLSPSASYKMNLGGTAISFLGTILSWFLMRNFGRRTVYLTGFVLMTLWLFLIGCLDLSHHSSVRWGQAALCLIWLATFSLTVGPLGWSIAPEVSSTRLRSKSVVLARNAYYLGQTVSTVIEPYMINPTAGNWRGKTGFFWFGTSVVTVVWAFFRLPETKGRTYEELDLMFAAKTPTLKFKKYRVDAYSEDATNQVKEA